MSAFSPRQLFLLDSACQPIGEAFGGHLPYLVGSSQTGRDGYRDVDVRQILKDENYDALNTLMGADFITFLGLAIGEYLASRTGLPIDFQLQRMTEANDRHDGPRNPLGGRNLRQFAGDARPEPKDAK